MYPLFSLRNVSLFYKRPEGVSKVALSHLNLDIFQNETLLIAGPNGCGKSSLARLLAGLADHFEGTLIYKGAEIKCYSRRCFDDVALTIQEPQNQILMSTVYEELSFPLEMRGYAKKDIAGKINEAASLFGIERLLHTKTDRLSGGQVSIVAMAAAAIADPPVIIFDEPDSHYDFQARSAFERYLVSIRGKKTVIVITQYPDSMIAADRMAIMKSGKIVAVGEPARLLANKELLHECSLYCDDHQNVRGGGAVKSQANEKQPLLSLSGVGYIHKSGDFALEDIGFDIFEGDKVGIVGPIGSGKTTLGLLIAGVYKPDSGAILLDNRPMSAYEPKSLRRMVTMALQFPEKALIEYTVRGDILFGPKQLGIENPDKIAEAMLELFAIEELDDKNPLELSGGQKRKTALAGIFALKSRLVVLDEPTASLDPESVNELVQVIAAKPQTAFVIIGHDLRFLVRVCDRIIGIENGRLAFDVSKFEFIQKYRLI